MLNTCLGDLFSVNWMEDTESHNPMTETLMTQYTDVKKKTTKSPVCEFGNLDIQSEYVGMFEGDESQVGERDSDFFDQVTSMFKSTGRLIEKAGGAIKHRL